MTLKTFINIYFYCVFISWAVVKVKSFRLKPCPNVSKMVIDQDAGADDGMAILMALQYETYFQGPKIVGLTTVNGNVNETQAYINTQKILNVAGRLDIPIFRGSPEALVIPEPTDEYFGIDGLGDLGDYSYRQIQPQPLQAALALIQLSKKYAGQLIIVTLAPLTNIALAIKLDRGFIGRLKHIIVGGGNYYDPDYPQSTKPEFNVKLDPESYRILADHAVPSKLTVVPYSQIKKYITITTDWRINELGKIPTKIIKALNAFESVSLPKDKQWQLLDPAVMAFALNSSLVDDVRLTKNNVVLCKECNGKYVRGITTNDFDTKEGNMKLIYSASKNEYQDFLLKVFSAN